MKIAHLFIFVFFISHAVISQTDTLFFASDKKVNCKIIEINDLEVKYKLVDLPEGPTYSVDKNRLAKYVLADGRSEVVVPGEKKKMHRSVSGGRTAIKILPIPFFLDHVSLTLEQVLSVGTNLELEVGGINNSILQGNFIYDGALYDKDPPFYCGLYFKPGIKVLLGEGFTSDASKPVHPLIGHYVRFDLAFSYVNYPSLSEREFNSYYLTRSVPFFNVRSISYGAFVNYGKQFIVGKKITFDCFVGLGFAWQENKCLNPVITQYGSYGLNTTSMAKISRYGAFYRAPNAGLAGSIGLRIGFIFKKKEKKNEGSGK